MTAEPLPGPFDLVLCIASSHALGGFPEALERLRELARPGGQVLLGEGYWRRPPTPEYLEALGGATPDELADCGGLLKAARTAGLVALWSCAASENDWDRYAGDPLAEDVRARAALARHRLALPGGRETLGFALLLLGRA